MKLIIDETLHQEHTRVLVAQLVADTVEVLEQYGLFTKEQTRGITRDLMFRLCAVLDGSSYPGTLNDEEIAPFVGFYVGSESEDVLIPEGGSAMHEFAEELVEKHYTATEGD